MFTKTDDPIADFNRYEAERNKKLSRLPKCRECDNPIQDETAYLFNDEFICEHCMETNYRVFVDNYIE